MLRGQVSERMDRRFAHKTRESLIAEPTVLSPTPRIAPLLKPVAGLAIAASVAALAIFGARQLLHVNAPEPAPQVVQQIPRGAPGFPRPPQLKTCVPL